MTNPTSRRWTLRIIFVIAVIVTAIAARIAHDRAARRVLQLEAEARINFEHGKPEEAERQLLVALSIDSGSPRAIALLAAVRTTLGKGEQAEKDLRDALARTPRDPVLAVTLASTLSVRGRAEEAWAVVAPIASSLAATRDPMERAQFLVATAQVALARRVPADAEPLLRAAAEARPGESAPAARAFALQALGRFLATSGRFAEADPVLAEAQALVPADLGPVTQRALVLEQLGRRGDAIALMRAAPIPSAGAQRLDALSTLGDLLVRSGQFREARLLATSIGQDPDLFALASYVTGSVAFALADYKDAQAAFGRLAAAFPTSPWPHMVRARAALLSGALDEARAEYVAAERLRPGTPEVALALVRLDEITGHAEPACARALELLADPAARAGGLRVLLASPLAPARLPAIRKRLEALLAEKPRDPWLRFFVAVLRVLAKDGSGVAELETLAREGPELESAFAPQSRLDLVSIDRLEVVEWVALRARHEALFAPARAPLAEVFLRLGRTDLAVATLEPVLADEAPSRAALLLWAGLAPTDRDAARTAEVLERLGRDAPDAPLLAALAGVRERLGDRAAARDLLARAAARAPADASLRGRLGLLDAALGDATRALADLDAARQIAPADFVANLDGAVALGRGDLARATSALRRAWETTRDPRFAGALAAALALSGDAPSGVRAFEAAGPGLASNPDGALLRALLLALATDDRAASAASSGPAPAAVRAAALAATREQAAPGLELFALGLLGAPTGVRSRIERVAADAAADPLALWWAERALRPGDPPALRVTLARRLAALAPRDPGVALELAAAQLAVGDAKGAAATGRALVAALPGQPGLELRLAMLLEAAGETDEALVAYERAQAKAPSATALNNMAWLLSRDRAPTAINYAREAVRLDPNLGEACDTLAALLLDAGKLDEAELLLERAGALLPQSGSVRYHLAVLFRARGERERAMHHVQVALRAPRSFSDIEKARALAQQLAREDHR